jgi:hypothetical protein
MVYLLHRYFGRDGREEAEALLERRSGDEDNPRILGAFNEPTPDWLAFYMLSDGAGLHRVCVRHRFMRHRNRSVDRLLHQSLNGGHLFARHCPRM